MLSPTHARMVHADLPFAWHTVDDRGRFIVENESYGVAAAVERAYNNRMYWEPGEAYEIADAHHAARRQWNEE